MALAWRSSGTLPEGPPEAPLPWAWPVALVPAAVVVGSQWLAGTTSSDALTELRGRTDWLVWWTQDAGMPSRLHRLVRTAIGGADALAPTHLLHAVLVALVGVGVLRAARTALPHGPWALVAVAPLVSFELLQPFAGVRARALAAALLVLAMVGFQGALAGRVRGGVRAFAVGAALAMLDDPTTLGALAPAALLLALRVPGAGRAVLGALALGVAALLWPAIDAVRFHAEAGSADAARAGLPIQDALWYPALLVPLVLFARARGTSTPAVQANAWVAGLALAGAAAGLAAGVLPSESKSLSALVPWATLAIALALAEAAPGRAGQALLVAFAAFTGLKTVEEGIVRPTVQAGHIRSLAAAVPPEVDQPGQVLVGPRYEVAGFLGALGRLTETPRELDLASPPFAVLGAGGQAPCSPGVWGVAWFGDGGPPTPPGLHDGPCTCSEHARAGHWTLYRCSAPATP